MTVFCQTLNPSCTFVSRSIIGSSEAAEFVQQKIDEGLRHYSQPRIESIMSEIEQIVEDSARSASLS